MATEEKKISSIGEDMPLADKDYENNKTGEMNEPLLFDSEPLILDSEPLILDSEPLLLDKEYDPENS